MAALVQTYPQQTTVTMLQGRPSSSGGYTPTQPQQHLGSRNAPSQKYNASSGSGSYRGMPSHGPVAPYAFTSTPQLANTGNSSRQYQNHSPHPRSENRTSSAPVTLQIQQTSVPSGAATSARQRYPTSSNSSPSTNLNQAVPRSMDDTSISSRSAMAESLTVPTPCWSFQFRAQRLPLTPPHQQNLHLTDIVEMRVAWIPATVVQESHPSCTICNAFWFRHGCCRSSVHTSEPVE